MFLTGPAGSGKRTSVMRVLFRTQTMRVNLKEAKLSKSFLRTLGIGRATALVAKYGKPSFFTTMTMDGAHSEDVGAREEMKKYVTCVTRRYVSVSDALRAIKR